VPCIQSVAAIIMQFLQLITPSGLELRGEAGTTDGINGIGTNAINQT